MQSRRHEFFDFILGKQLFDFDSFETALSSLEDNSLKGILFEEYCRSMFMTKLFSASNVWRPEELPINVAELLNTPTKDMGIDFVAKIDDKYYAIQCKFRSIKTQLINWSRTSTFLGAVYQSGKFDGSYYISNTININDMVRNSTVKLLLRDYLSDNKKFDLIIKSQDIESDSTLYSLRECQINAIQKFEEYFSNDSNLRGRIQMACGTGKTRVAYELCNEFNKIVILVPSLYLLNQFYTNFVHYDSFTNRNKNYLLIGSDIDTSDAMNRNYILTTDKDKVAESIVKNEQIIIVCTYQSQDILHNVMTKKRGKTIDIMMFDEAHKTAGGDESKAFALFLKTNEELKVNIRKRLFLTATERLIRSVDDDTEIYSMDNEDKYGKQIYNYPMGKAIEDKILSDYRVVFPLVDANVKEDILKQKYIGMKIEDLVKEYPADLLMCAIMIKKMFDEGEIKYLLTYHSSIRSANSFSQLLNYMDMMNAYALDGSHSMKLRNNTIEEFKKNGGVICSVKVFNEGVDIPFCDSVCFINGRESKIDIIQCIGRCLRLYDGKKIATIILPIFVENKEDEQIESDNYIFQIIRAISDNDFRVYDEIKNRKNKSGGTGRLVFKNYTYTKTETSELDFEDICDNIELQVMGRLDIVMQMTWHQSYELLIKFIDEYKKLPLQTEIYNGYNIGGWCSDMRKKKYKFDNDKVNKLNNIKIWSWNILEDAWNNNYDLLVKFVDENKRMPYNNEIYNNIKLGDWCRGQKAYMFSGKLKQEKIDKFNELSVWSWNKKTDNWNEHYELLKEYVQVYKRQPINKEIYKKYNLDSWTRIQKKKYKNGSLNNDYINKLSNIPFWSWNNILEDNWDKNYDEFIKFIKKHKKLPNQHENSLGQWCSDMRKRRDILPNDKIKKFNEIPIWSWNINEDAWNFYLNLLLKFINENKRLPVRDEMYYKNNIGDWCQMQRIRKEKLSKKHLDELEKIEIWSWDIIEDKWNLNYECLLKFIKINNRMPKKKESFDNINIGSWCQNQRTINKNEKITHERKEKLNEISLWYW